MIVRWYLFGTTTQAQTAAAFRKWLAATVRDVVLAHEAGIIDEANNAAKRTALATTAASLPDPGSVT